MAVPAVVVDGKTGVEESLFVFPVAHGVIVPASGLPVPFRSHPIIFIDSSIDARRLEAKWVDHPDFLLDRW